MISVSVWMLEQNFLSSVQTDTLQSPAADNKLSYEGEHYFFVPPPRPPLAYRKVKPK